MTTEMRDRLQSLMFVWWGPNRINIYNDAYVPVLARIATRTSPSPPPATRRSTKCAIAIAASLARR